MHIGIIGNGAFGKAIATLLHRNGHESLAVDVGETLNAAGPFDVIVLAVPAVALHTALAANKEACAHALVVNTAKGLGEGGRLPHAIVASALTDVPYLYASLFGPSLAEDVAHGRPVAFTVGTENDAEAETIARLFQENGVILDRSRDPLAIELDGVLKNVYAILFGYASGMKLGKSGEAALFSAALREYELFAKAAGASPDLPSYGCLGDFALSFLPHATRNHTLGVLLADTPESEINTVLKDKTCDGYHTVRLLSEKGVITNAFPLLKAVEAITLRGSAARPTVEALFH